MELMKTGLIATQALKKIEHTTVLHIVCHFKVLTLNAVFLLDRLPTGNVEYLAGERSSAGDIGGALATEL